MQHEARSIFDGVPPDTGAHWATGTGARPNGAAPPARKLLALNLVEFLSRDIPPREMLLDPFLPTQGLMMLYSWRGVGKTHTGIGIAYAAASGGAFLRWQAPKPRRV